MQEYANVVSIKRLGFNDHGPVHMRKAALNAMIMFNLLDDAKIVFNLEKEEQGTVEDSRIAVLVASLLHDLGMTVSRNKHEFISVYLSIPIIVLMKQKLSLSTNHISHKVARHHYIL
jgi:metal-dependent HD superfamily phosphatase/phosphodiesterase